VTCQTSCEKQLSSCRYCILFTANFHYIVSKTCHQAIAVAECFVDAMLKTHLKIQFQSNQVVCQCLTVSQLNSIWFREDGDIGIGLNHRFLTQPTAERVVNAMATPSLDYCNALLFGTATDTIARLHNTAACLITRQARSESATVILRQMHWLPI